MTEDKTLWEKVKRTQENKTFESCNVRQNNIKILNAYVNLYIYIFFFRFLNIIFTHTHKHTHHSLHYLSQAVLKSYCGRFTITNSAPGQKLYISWVQTKLDFWKSKRRKEGRKGKSPERMKAVQKVVWKEVRPKGSLKGRKEVEKKGRKDGRKKENRKEGQKEGSPRKKGKEKKK